MQSDDAVGLRLSPLQEELWLSQGEGHGFRAVCAIRLRGKLNGDAMRDAAVAVAGRHENLRCTLRRRAGLKTPFQVVGKDASFGLRRVALGAAAGTEALDALIAEEARRPADFEQGPLWQLTLATLADDDHVLVVSAPAIVADTTSLVHFAQELRHFYAVACLEVGEGVADEPLQYADFAAFQHERVATGDARASEGEAYWRSLDLAATPNAKLPFAHDPPVGALFSPGSVAVNLGATTLEAAALLAAWQVLLACFSGQSAVVTHVTCDGRDDDEVRGAIGLFARAVPVRAEVEASLPFAEVVSRARAASADASTWKDYFTRGAAAPIVFDHAASIEDAEVAGLSFSLLSAFSHTEHFALKLSCLVGPGTSSAALHYDAERFVRADVERIAASLEALVRSAAREPGVEVRALELMSASERERIVSGFNRTATAFPEDTCVHELFEQQARSTPDRPALVFGDVRLTYAELDTRANRLARHLRHRGVTANSAVGLCVDRSAEMIIGLLGILKAGAGYVPLLPDAPPARLAHQLGDLGAPALVTEARWLAALPAFDGEIVCLDRDAALLAEESGEPLARVGSPGDLAYVIYTSGSTGTPKGVAVRHDNLVNYTHFIAAKLGLAEAQAKEGLHFATVSTLAADLGNTCIFPCLTTGGCLHVISQDVGMDGDAFAAYAKSNPIDVLKITPSQLTALLAARDAQLILPRRVLITGGEASSWGLVQRVRELGNVVWLNHYGPTETTIGSLTFDVDRDEAVRALAATVPIGRPIANTQAYVLDAHLAPVPIGAPGELHLAGRGVSRGYLKQPEQTAARFLADPFSSDPSARMYKTGDRVRWLPDGDIEFLGRVDHQVKIRGYRVELGEIEAVLRRHPDVREALVVARDEQLGGVRLIAYLVFTRSAGRAAPRAEEWRTLLSRDLPDYMVPAAFVTLDELPLTANGKVDRAALPAPEQASGKGGDGGVPRTPTETKLAQIWAEMLKVESVGVNDDFFELGGHSMLATQIIARARTAFRVNLTLLTLFQKPTVAGLAAAIDAAESDVASVMAELEGLTDEEVAALLAADQAE